MQRASSTLSYDTIAQTYDEMIREGRLIHEFVVPRLLALVGNVAGQRVLDLACGQGVVARQLAERGAQVVGVNLSEDLLNLARGYACCEAQRITYLQDDAEQLTSLPDACFDGVLLNMALTDIGDIDALFQTVSRVMRRAGWFAFSTPHPCFQSPYSRWSKMADGRVSAVIAGYFEEGFWMAADSTRLCGLVGAYHRTLGTIFASLNHAGLLLTDFVEPRASAAFAARKPGYESVAGVLLVCCQKGAPDVAACDSDRPPCARREER